MIYFFTYQNYSTLNNNQFDGTIPTEIFQLKNLGKLFFFFSFFFSIIFWKLNFEILFLGNFLKIILLVLFQLKLVNSLISNLCLFYFFIFLISFKSFFNIFYFYRYFGSNKIEGPIPAEITNCSSLEILYFLILLLFFFFFFLTVLIDHFHQIQSMENFQLQSLDSLLWNNCR